MNKILHLTSNYVDAFYKELFESIDSRGFESTVFVPQKIGFDDCPKAQDVIKSQCYSMLDRFFLRRKSKKIVNSMYKLLNIKEFDLIHAHSLYTCGVPAYHFYKECGLPYVVSLRFNDTDVFPKYNLFTKGLINEVLRNAKAIVFITPIIKKKAERIFKYLRSEDAKKKCFVIPNKVSEMFLNNGATPKLPHKDHLKILFVGKQLGWKRLDLLAKNCSKIFKNGDVLDVVSSTNILPTKLVNKYKFFNYIGRVKHDELYKNYRDADIFALISVGETFGISYIEAMSQGTPIILSKNEAIDGTYPNGEVGYSINGKSVKEFKKAVELILSDYENISKRCIEHAKEYSDENVVGKIVEIYRS